MSGHADPNPPGSATGQGQKCLNSLPFTLVGTGEVPALVNFVIVLFSFFLFYDYFGGWCCIKDGHSAITFGRVVGRGARGSKTGSIISVHNGRWESRVRVEEVESFFVSGMLHSITFFQGTDISSQASLLYPVMWHRVVISELLCTAFGN